MIELDEKLAQLGDAERIALYHNLLERFGESAEQTVKELVLVYEESAEIDPDSVKALASQQLPEHERPTRFVSTAKLPRSSHGKLDRRGLPALIRTERRSDATSVFGAGISNKNIEAVVETFNRVLGTSSISPESNFFELGGHSLLAVECILALEERTGRRISITQFLNHPTAGGIAQLLNEQNQQTYKYVYPVSEDRSGLPVFVFSSSNLSYALKKRKADWTIYGIQLRWRDEKDDEILYRDIEHMASCIAEEIRQLVLDRDFVLTGSSFPGILAFEVARQLRASGAESALTVLIEPTFIYSGVRGWIENDLAQSGNLRAGENPYIRWLRINHPLRSSFWRRVSRRRARKRDTRTTHNNRINSKAQFAEYENIRATALWKSYRPATYDGPAVLMTCPQTKFLYRRDWIQLLEGNKVNHYADLDTDHFEILREPFMSDTVVPLVISEVESSLRSKIAAGLTDPLSWR